MMARDGAVVVVMIILSLHVTPQSRGCCSQLKVQPRQAASCHRCCRNTAHMVVNVQYSFYMDVHGEFRWEKKLEKEGKKKESER